MYLDYWNLREAPFQNVADPRFAYLCEQHHEGLARLVYLAENRKLGGILMGPYGIGKSMVLELLAQQIRKNNGSTYVGLDYLPGKPVSFARNILTELGFDEAARSLDDPADAIIHLRKEMKSIGHVVMTIDEAQGIDSADLYHFLHLLTNITLRDADEEKPPHPAFTIILSGYSDMTKLLAEDESLCQRLKMVWRLEPLSPQQVLEYVQHRIRVAGGDIWMFEEDAIQALSTTEFIPRTINNVCDMALMLGYAANVRTIDRNIMLQALDETGTSSNKLADPKSTEDHTTT